MQKLTGLEVHIGTPIEKCRETNGKLLQDDSTDGGYEEDIFENLVFRYEEPIQRLTGQAEYEVE